MVAVDNPASPALRQSFSADDDTARRIGEALLRALVAEGISDDLIDTLEETFADRPAAVRRRRFDGLLLRFGLPLPRRKPPAAAQPFSQEEAMRITNRFRRATHQLVRVVPQRVQMYPTEELGRLLALYDEQPEPGAELAYLRRYALVIVALLDLIGDDA